MWNLVSKSLTTRSKQIVMNASWGMPINHRGPKIIAALSRGMLWAPPVVLFRALRSVPVYI